MDGAPELGAFKVLSASVPSTEVIIPVLLLLDSAEAHCPLSADRGA